MTAQELLTEFSSVVDEIHQLYLDCSLGFVHNKKVMEDSQGKSVEKLGLSITHQDTLPVLFGVGAPGESTILQQSTQKEFKLRNQRGGKNHITLGNLCVVQLYQYWEDHYRIELSTLLSLDKNVITSDFFGDLRLFRLSIIHHKAVAKANINNCKILQWFSPGETIVVSADRMDHIFLMAKEEIKALQKKYCC
jgi:hypothetical protein